MRLIDLTMPIWEGAGYGEVLAMPNVSVRFNEYMFYDQNGIRMTHIKIDDESGSTIMTPHQGSPHRRGPIREGVLFTWKLDEIPLERLILRDTVVLDVPGEDYHIITAEEIDAAVAKADYREGDDVIVRTGWATTEKAYALGNDYCVVAPSWGYEACVSMAKIMVAKKSGIIMTDCPLVGPPGVQGYAWSVGEEQIIPRPKPWPSAEARERMMDGAPPVPASVGRSGYGELVVKTIGVIKGLVDTNQITTSRVKTLILPMFIKQGGASPCGIIAVEE